MRTCIECGIEKDKRQIPMSTMICRACRKRNDPEVRERVNANKRAWRAANAEKANAGVQRWKNANRERVRELEAEYRERHGEEIRLRGLAWREDNADRKRENDARWREENAERVADNKRKERARKRRAISEPYRDEDVMAKTEGLCYLCEMEIDFEAKRLPTNPLSFTIEHVIALINGGPDVLANVMPAHRFCNSSKGERELDELPESWFEELRARMTR